MRLRGRRVHLAGDQVIFRRNAQSATKRHIENLQPQAVSHAGTPYCNRRSPQTLRISTFHDSNVLLAPAPYGIGIAQAGQLAGSQNLMAVRAQMLQLYPLGTNSFQGILQYIVSHISHILL